MNREIDLKKYFLFLCIYLFILFLVLYFVFGKINPFCKIESPCLKADCSLCESKNGKKECHECSIFNEDDERIWVGSCIYEE